MDSIRFTKMHGIGNDYVYIDCFKQKLSLEPSTLAVKISDRHFGVGSDGLVLIMPSDKADFRMRMFNSDGSEAEMCGNAIRCVGKYAYDRKLTSKTTVTVDTLAGIKELQLSVNDGEVSLVRVDMGEPVLQPDNIPVEGSGESFINQPAEIEGECFNLTCVSMGNPHAVMFVDDTARAPVETVGPRIENYRIFPRRTNVEFVHVVDRQRLDMRVWERGAGETLACGTGACAAFAASVLNGLCDRKVIMGLLGGELELEWNEGNNHIYMTGPAEIVFDGEFYLK